MQWIYRINCALWAVMRKSDVTYAIYAYLFSFANFVRQTSLHMPSQKLEDLSYRIIGCAMRVHSELGAGLLESAYEKCLMLELEFEGIQAESQKLVSIQYRGTTIHRAYYIDILVEKEIILEIKSVDRFVPEHKAQLLTYMRLHNSQLGFLINFGAPKLRDGIQRMIWTNNK